jgi:hypothetical protein
LPSSIYFLKHHFIMGVTTLKATFYRWTVSTHCCPIFGHISETMRDSVAQNHARWSKTALKPLGCVGFALILAFMPASLALGGTST